MSTLQDHPSGLPSPRTLFWVVPLAIAGQLLFLEITLWRSESLVPSALAWGALGWVLALALRMPVIAAVHRMSANNRMASYVTIGLSGPAEESVRLVMVLTVVSSVAGAYSLGFGWGLIEVAYGIVNGFAVLSLAQRRDEKAQQALEQMRAMGLRPETPPAWGIAERLSATALHIGFALLLKWNGWLVVALIPTHSATNLGVLQLNKRSAVSAQAALAVVGFGALVLGVALTGF